LLSIHYSITSNQLFREDITNRSETKTLALLDQIKTATIRILDHQNKWQIKWNYNEDSPAKAIEIKFSHPHWGDLIKLVMLDG
jgi:hypothetical protein